METSTKNLRKRTQRDYTLAFKLSVVDQVEKGEFTYKQAQAYYGIQGKSTVLTWLRKHGTLDWMKLSERAMSKKTETPEQKIKRLETLLQDKEDYAYLLEETIKKVDELKGTDFSKKFLDSLPAHLRKTEE
tara:strand:- start:237 stop:629 length:393 start_codon:yes stop_codon:yes gene_type:complete